MTYKTYEVRVYDGDTKFWYLNGKLHRDNGPAIEYANGDKEWWVNGKLHRDNGPAIEFANGSKSRWYLNGKRHREDGPAVEWVNDKEWWVNGVEFTEKKFNQRNQSCEGKIVEIEGKRYKLTAV